LVSYGFGQADLIVFAFTGLALVLALRGRPGWSGAAVAAAACVKIYPALLLLPLAKRFGWRPLAAAAGFSAAAAALAMLWFGPGIFGDFVRDALRLVSQGFPHPENLSPGALLMRLAIHERWADPARPSPAWL